MAALYNEGDTEFIDCFEVDMDIGSNPPGYTGDNLRLINTAGAHAWFKGGLMDRHYIVNDGFLKVEGGRPGFYADKHYNIPTNAGWDTTLTYSGVCVQKPSCLKLSTGVTATSIAFAQTPVFGLDAIQGYLNFVDFSKDFELSFDLMRYNTDAQVVATVRVMQQPITGVMNDKGIGLYIANFTVTGEAYGNELGTVALTTLETNREYHFRIVKTNNRVQFWINDLVPLYQETLLGSITDADQIPLAGTDTAYVYASIINGAAGGVNASLYIGNIQLKQEQ
jgi:hypothetical protein